MLLQLSHFPPFILFCPAHPLPPTLPTFSSCPWVILISSLASTFPTLFVPSLCLFSTYHLCYLFLIPFPPFLPPLLCWKSSMWSPFLWFCSCPSCLLSLCLFSSFFLGSVVHSCEFLVTLLFIFFDLLFLRWVPLTFHIIRAWWWWTP